MTWSLLIWALVCWEWNPGNQCPDGCTPNVFKVERNRIEIAVVNVMTLCHTDQHAKTGDLYRVRATNALGDSPYTPEVPLLTVAQKPDSASVVSAQPTFLTIPQDLSAAKATATSVQLTWSTITDPQVKYITVRVSVNGQPYTLILDSKTFPPTSSFTHANLGTGTYRYQLRVWSQQDKLLGESNESNLVTI